MSVSMSLSMCMSMSTRADSSESMSMTTILPLQDSLAAVATLGNKALTNCAIKYERKQACA